MTVLSIQRIRDGVLASATSATLSIVDSSNTPVLATTTITPTSTGVYSYEITNLSAGAYTATWIFTTTGLPTDTISRAFNVDFPVDLTDGIMLLELERLIARRVGPYRAFEASFDSTQNMISSLELRSSLTLGSYEDLYVFRRKLTPGLEVVPDITVSSMSGPIGDQVRRVTRYIPTLGQLEIDLAYEDAPVFGELFELHALDPLQELRPCAQEGLKRCFFWDTVEISVTGSGVYNINLSASMPWLTQPSWVRDVSLSYPSQLLPPRRMQWWQVYREGRNLKLYTKGGAVGSVTVTVLRPAHTLVNGEMSLTGPNDQLDVVYIDPDYAAWAGVLEAWKNCPEVLQPLAAQNMRPSRQDAATEFSKKSQTLVQHIPEFFQVDYGRSDIVQIGNLAEPV